MFKIALGFLILLGFTMTARAQTDVIRLVDGSQIQGEVIGMKNGSYTIQSASLGTISIAASKVKSIVSSSPNNGVSSTMPESGAQTINDQSMLDQLAGGQLQSIQQSIMGNAELVSSIMRLQSDPDMQAILNDPEVMAMVQRFDFEGLKNNPKIQKLMRNAKVREIQAKAAP